MTKFKIIKNAEIPNIIRAGRPTIYPFGDMAVGDGFDAPDDLGVRENGKDGGQVSVRASSIRVCASVWAKRHNPDAKRHNPDAKFTTRRLDETTIRCVRVA